MKILRYTDDAAGRAGLSPDPGTLRTGQNSGHQAINLAAHFTGPGGEIVALGFDMKFADGRRHCHPDHAEPLGNPTDRSLDDWLGYAETIPADAADLGLTILNASRDTAMTCFPRATIEEIFPC